MTPKIVAFDLGKVLVDFDFTIAANKLAAQVSRPVEEIRAVIQTSPILVRFESGQTSNEQFYREVCQAIGYQGAFDEFANVFADIFWPIDPMIAWHERLRRRGVPTYIFSNTNDLAVAHIRRRFPFFSNFTGYIYSYQVGAMKPAPAIYEALERLSGGQGAEILYLDDRLENLEAGRACGWQTIHHQDVETTLTELKRLGMD